MSDPTTNILVVEDEKVFAEVVREIVTAEGNGAYVVTVAGSLTAATAQLTSSWVDLILLDLTLPDRTGLDTYLALREAGPQVPVIVLSGLNDEETALRALRAGAQDYLLKNEFDGRLLARAIRYALERSRVELRLRESEQFFRLISENMTDLISVVDGNGKRIYNSPSYQAVLGPRDDLTGTNSFAEIHPDDRDAIQSVFREVVATGQGRRAEYRFVRNDGSVRHVESQSSVIRNQEGVPQKIVVVSRDVTERLEAEHELRRVLAEVKRSHEQLQVAQRKLVQSEKLEAVSTFAAGVAHEVKNPLQTVVLGIDYLRDYVVVNDPTATDLLQQMSEAVQRADAFVKGLLEFSSYRKGAVSDQDLGQLFEQTMAALESELTAQSIQVRADYAPDLPKLRLDPRALRHVLISLLGAEINTCPVGSELFVRTYLKAPPAGPNGRSSVVAETEVRHPGSGLDGSTTVLTKKAAPGSGDDFRIMVARKIIELYGGRVERHRTRHGHRFTISFSN
jgi:two-component system cell cycle sensor histidine kinase/response regulator CckA